MGINKFLKQEYSSIDGKKKFSWAPTNIFRIS
jgi:hypothetical protein